MSRHPLGSGVTAAILLFSSWVMPCRGADLPAASAGGEAVTIFHPSGVHGLIVYETQDPAGPSAAVYSGGPVDLSARWGLPVTLEVQGFNMVAQGSAGLRRLAGGAGDDTMEVFSIRHGLAYATPGRLSPLREERSEITMVVASAKYRAGERFRAKLSTGLARAVNEDRPAAAPGYEVDVSGVYRIAPGLSFSVAAGYAARADLFGDAQGTPAGDDSSWSLISKIRVRF